MPYTNPWSVLIPLGSSPAAQLDSFIQQTRLDLAERINTMIGGGGSMSNDPVIDGITAKSLTQLTTELATKTTVTGLTAGRLIKAATPTTIINSLYTEAQLGSLLPLLAPAAATGAFVGGGVGPHNVLVVPFTGLIIITVTGLSSTGGGAANGASLTLAVGALSAISSGCAGNTAQAALHCTLIAAVTAGQTITATVGINGTNLSSPKYSYAYIGAYV